MSCGGAVCVVGPNPQRNVNANVNACSLLNFAGKQRTDKLCCRSSSSSAGGGSEQEKVKEKVLKQAATAKRQRCRNGGGYRDSTTRWDVNEAYDLCVELANKDKSLFSFTNISSDSLLHSILSFITKIASSIIWKPERSKAIAALAVWCRRTDELVDGVNSCYATPEVLDKWEQRLIDIFQGHPSDICDAALSDAISKYPIDIQLMKDLIEGMRLDLKKTRYENFDELYLYSYYVAGTVAIMAVQMMGTAPESKASLERVYEAALAFGIATQLTDILRDIGEDASIGRIYLPQDELAQAGLSDDDIYKGKVTDKWRNFMREQIKRARMYSDEGEKMIGELNSDDRWAFLVWDIVESTDLRQH